MNECEQIHPLLRGYMAGTLTAGERRVVARHLNLCASARKEMDRLRGGPLKGVPDHSARTPQEPWDLKLLRWLFRTGPLSTKKEQEPSVKKGKPVRPAEKTPSPRRSASPWKPIFLILMAFLFLAFLTHFVQNLGENKMMKDLNHWLASKGIHALGVTSDLELVSDLTGLARWSGNAAPTAVSFHEVITDQARLQIYWAFLQPGTPAPAVDFSKNSMVLLFLGGKPTGTYEARFKREETYPDKTILWYDETGPLASPAPPKIGARPWTLQLVPKPAQSPVLVQKIQ